MEYKTSKQLKGKIKIDAKDRTIRMYEAMTQDKIICYNCGEEISPGQDIYITSDKGDIYCSNMCVCGSVLGQGVYHKDNPKTWKPREHYDQVWKCILKKIKGDVNDAGIKS